MPSATVVELTQSFFAYELDKILIAAGLGAIIGLEREFARKDPSLRTFSLICLGSCIFSIMSTHAAQGVPNAEPSRIAAQIVTGIGFIGAGTIFRAKDRVRGLTTAALMWVTAALGMAVGFGKIELAVAGTITVLAVNYLLNQVHKLLRALRGEAAENSSTMD